MEVTTVIITLKTRGSEKGNYMKNIYLTFIRCKIKYETSVIDKKLFGCNKKLMYRQKIICVLKLKIFLIKRKKILVKYISFSK